jgi:hypothetical protein
MVRRTVTDSPHDSATFPYSESAATRRVRRRGIDDLRAVSRLADGWADF